MDEAGEPIFVEGPTGRPATVVVVWPTDERGYIISSELGLARAAIWELESGMEQRLQDLICAMPLELYDLRVRRGHVIQWPRTLRSSSWYRSLERTIDQLALGLSA